MTTYGYMRVSTDDQNTNLQLDALQAAGVPVGNITADDGVSGGTAAASRAGFQALLTKLVSGDTLVVYSVSRVGRSTIDVLLMLESLGERGVKFKSLTEPFDTTTPMGEFVLTILAAVGTLERAMIRQRTTAGLAAARARGTKLGRPRVAPDAEAKVRAGLAAGLSGRAAAKAAGVGHAVARRLMLTP